MKNLLFVVSLFMVGLLNAQTGTLTDSRDGKIYKTVVIGNQTWMAENLNVATFRNGDPIPQVKTIEEWEKASERGKPAWCYYDYDPKNGTKYGKLYNWFAVSDPRGIAPRGWHIPDHLDWIDLEEYLGDAEFAGDKMKNTNGWSSYGCRNCYKGSEEFQKSCPACKGSQDISSKPFSGNGINSFGFTSLPSGIHNGNVFFGKGFYCSYWCADELFTENAISYFMWSYNGALIWQNKDKIMGLSVRCLKD